MCPASVPEKLDASGQRRRPPEPHEHRVPRVAPKEVRSEDPLVCAAPGDRRGHHRSPLLGPAPRLKFRVVEESGCPWQWTASEEEVEFERSESSLAARESDHPESSSEAEPDLLESGFSERWSGLRATPPFWRSREHSNRALLREKRIDRADCILG